ncbi:MAG: glycosyl hydrolase [Burkholderiales bacterium]|nr:glycosyl hydrolase [Burkholderiales bacterium]
MERSGRSTARARATDKRTHARPPRIVVLVATRKGAWLYYGDAARRAWRVAGPYFLGHVISHVVLDPRDRRTLLAAAKTGHLGPTVFRSIDRGRTWHEAARPPAFPKAPAEAHGRAVDHTFWLTPGHASEPGVWYAGTSPQGLFRSEDGGVTWAPFSSINDDPRYRKWMGTVQDGTPDGPKLHSIIVDPRDPAHLYFAMSGGGVHESRDLGRTWAPILDGLEVVEGFDRADPTYHDPHCVRLCPSNPDRLYQQNHCGIYRLDRPSRAWVRIGTRMPGRVGDIGFPLVVHPRDADAAWVFPMDGTTVWPRTSPGGMPAVYATRNGGRTWQRLAAGLPQEQAWWTVKRQAMSIDGGDPVGLYFGTTSGELWASRDEGRRWRCIARHLPEIYAVEAAAIG